MIQILTGTYQTIDPTPHGTPARIELDLGCGKGRFALELARRSPDTLVLASDVMLGRLRKVQRKAERQNLTNLNLLRASSLDLVAYQLPPTSIDRIHLLCPDPWPKSKHRNKRLVTTDFLARLRRVLKPDGVLHLSTDHAPYLEDWKRMLAQLPFYENAPKTIEDVRSIQTDFELIWRKVGKTVPHLGYRLVSPANPPARPRPQR